MTRNAFEAHIEQQLFEHGVVGTYEAVRVPWLLKQSSIYTPDYYLLNGIVIECKGYFRPNERKKHVLIKEQYPELDLRFVFCRAPGSRRLGSATKITNRSKTSYGDWCTKSGFLYADDSVPEAWFSEPVNEASLALIRQFKREKKNV